jgi:hypothetical protein
MQQFHKFITCNLCVEDTAALGASGFTVGEKRLRALLSTKETEASRAVVRS